MMNFPCIFQQGVNVQKLFFLFALQGFAEKLAGTMKTEALYSLEKNFKWNFLNKKTNLSIKYIYTFYKLILI